MRMPDLRLPMLAKELTEMARRPRTYVVRTAFATLLFALSGLLFVPGYRLAAGAPSGLFGQGARAA